MGLQEYTDDEVWSILSETVHSLVMFSNHKAYTREMILPQKTEITPSELAARLKVPLGEALVILCELSEERQKQLDNLAGT
jgi:hypothetical protein